MTQPAKPCAHPKPAEMTEEHYEGVFRDTPIAVFACLLCTACGALVRGWAPRTGELT